MGPRKHLRPSKRQIKLVSVGNALFSVDIGGNLTQITFINIVGIRHATTLVCILLLCSQNNIQELAI